MRHQYSKRVSVANTMWRMLYEVHHKSTEGDIADVIRNAKSSKAIDLFNDFSQFVSIQKIIPSHKIGRVVPLLNPDMMPTKLNRTAAQQSIQNL